MLGNTHARHVVLDLLVPCLLGTPSSSGIRYCQVHQSAGDIVLSSSFDMPKPTGGRGGEGRGGREVGGGRVGGREGGEGGSYTYSNIIQWHRSI